MATLTEKEKALKKFINAELKGVSESKRADVRFAMLGLLSKNQGWTIPTLKKKTLQLISIRKKKNQL